MDGMAFGAPAGPNPDRDDPDAPLPHPLRGVARRLLVIAIIVAAVAAAALLLDAGFLAAMWPF